MGAGWGAEDGGWWGLELISEICFLKILNIFVSCYVLLTSRLQTFCNIAINTHDKLSFIRSHISYSCSLILDVNQVTY